MINTSLKVIKVSSEEEYQRYIGVFNEETKIITNEIYNYYMSLLYTGKQQKMFHDWWCGKRVNTPEYLQELDLHPELVEEVVSCILEACR